ncbi:integrase, catalytic region, zinc finger, CCHC-type containing protein [Tanacetum coccineum]
MATCHHLSGATWHFHCSPHGWSTAGQPPSDHRSTVVNDGQHRRSTAGDTVKTPGTVGPPLTTAGPPVNGGFDGKSTAGSGQELGRTGSGVGPDRVRIATTDEVLLRKPTALETNTPKPVVTLVYSRKPRKSKTNVPVSKPKIIKSISANNKEPSKSWGSIISDVPSSSLDECRSSKLFSVKFRNDHMAKILGYGDYQIGNVTISSVYYVEGLGHNLFFVGQFCDSNLEVAFRQHACFIRNLEGVDLLTGSHGNNLYTLSLGDMMASSPICLLSKASNTKSWLWHRCLSHLNFGAINHLARHGLVRGLPKLKFEKDLLYYACAMGKSKKNPTNLNLKTPTKKNFIFCTWIFVAQCWASLMKHLLLDLPKQNGVVGKP